MKVLVTGGAGFIGTEVCRLLVSQPNVQVINVDSLTYAANLEGVNELSTDDSYVFEKGDIRDSAKITSLLQSFAPDSVMHLAAESHVDRSIDDGSTFISSNVVGTQVLLDCALSYWRQLNLEKQEKFRFLHVSTDEVYGALGRHGQFSENSPYSPNSPYAASKAASNHLVRAWHQTYGLPVLTTNCSNNYGPYQFPEKLIPLIIGNALAGQLLPIYGTGENIRDWLYVSDHAEALLSVLLAGQTGEVYNIGGGAEKSNIELVHLICDSLDHMVPDSPYGPHSDLVTFVEDRPGHDFRYSIDDSKIRNKLGWMPKWGLEEGLRKTVAWYVANKEWMESVKNKSYNHSRRGLGEQ